MVLRPFFRLFFFFNDTATTEIYTISLHDALPIYALDFELPLLELENRIATLQAEDDSPKVRDEIAKLEERLQRRSEEHTSELQSRLHLVCRLLLEKKIIRTELDLASPCYLVGNMT